MRLHPVRHAWKDAGATAPAVGLLLAALVTLGGCKSPTTGPTATGSIQGQVLSDSTGAPIAGASITTNPPTSAPVSDANGKFTLSDLDTGDYSITARKSGYQTATVSVSVEKDRATSATILLPPSSTTSDVLEVGIDAVSSSTPAPDSVFTEVEYVVTNVSQDTLAEYDVIFNIFLPDKVLKQEETGNDLHPDQKHVGNFRKYVGSTPADSVRVGDIYTRKT